MHFSAFVLQESMITEANSLEERKRKSGGMKEMLQEATKLNQRLCFLVEEVKKCLKCEYFHVMQPFQYGRLGIVTHIHNTICVLMVQPQHTVPDMFVWLLSNNKRIAYARVRTRDLLYSSNQESRGILCGKIVTLFLKVNRYTCT